MKSYLILQNFKFLLSLFASNQIMSALYSHVLRVPQYNIHMCCAQWNLYQILTRHKCQISVIIVRHDHKIMFCI